MMKIRVNKEVFLCFFVTCCLSSGSAESCGPFEFECDDGKCIEIRSWCNRIPDCNDNSDEKYCVGYSRREFTCPKDYFRCKDGGCIPAKGYCDGFYSCSDFSDEENCRSIEFKDNVMFQEAPIVYTHSLDWHRNLAENFILSQRKDFAWGLNTPYAVLALYFSNPDYFRNDSKEVVLMKKKLELQLLLEMHRNQTSQMPLSTLSTYIAALQATCQHPRNFHDFDLVEILRYKAAVSNKPVNPFVYLILCLFGETSDSDFDKILEVFTPSNKNKQLDRLAFQSVALEAATCMKRGLDLTNFLVKLERMGPGNVYELALALEAMNQINDNSKNWRVRKDEILTSLLSLQQHTGSFGDIRATYYAMPSLSGNGFLSLRHSCQNKTAVFGPLASSKPADKRKIDVRYSLYIGSNQEVSYTLQMNVPSNSNLLHLMEEAQQKNPIFTFKYEIGYGNRPSVYSIAFVPNDVERETYWQLYKENTQRRENLALQNADISDLGLNHGDHIIYWYKKI